ncbi:hypothetical protein ABIC80_004357 [Kosakonia sp. 1610]
MGGFFHSPASENCRCLMQYELNNNLVFSILNWLPGFESA